MPRLGQLLSADAIEKMKESKRRRMISKYNWIIAEPYLDVEIDNGSANRVHNFITMREFRSRIEDGDSVATIKSSGISKHVIQFVSNFCQGKIKLTKEKLEKEYLSGLSLEEISKKYKVTREDLTYLRQLYGINRKGPKFIHRKKTEKPLTDRQKEILYGSLLGDAKATSPSSAGFGHGDKQKTYLFWKYTEFDNVASKYSLKSYPYTDKRSGFEGISWRFYTNANTDIEKILSEFYTRDGKEVSCEILSQLTPLSVAVWFMDDGTVDWRERQRRDDFNPKPYFSFCTDMFSIQSCENIVQWFGEKWQIKTRIKQRGVLKSGATSYRMVIKHESNDDFVRLIKPHVLPMFTYKIDYDAYLKWKAKAE